MELVLNKKINVYNAVTNLNNAHTVVKHNKDCNRNKALVRLKIAYDTTSKEDENSSL